jgi:hypothetical protein
MQGQRGQRSVDVPQDPYGSPWLRLANACASANDRSADARADASGCGLFNGKLDCMGELQRAVWQWHEAAL